LQFVDLKHQYSIIVPQIDLAIIKVLNQGQCNTKLHHTKKYSFDKKSVDLKKSISNFDLVTFATDHD